MRRDAHSTRSSNATHDFPEWATYRGDHRYGHNLGLHELARRSAEIESVMREVKFNGDFAALI